MLLLIISSKCFERTLLFPFCLLLVGDDLLMIEPPSLCGELEWCWRDESSPIISYVYLLLFASSVFISNCSTFTWDLSFLSDGFVQKHSTDYDVMIYFTKNWFIITYWKELFIFFLIITYINIFFYFVYKKAVFQSWLSISYEHLYFTYVSSLYFII